MILNYCFSVVCDIHLAKQGCPFTDNDLLQSTRMGLPGPMQCS